MAMAPQAPANEPGPMKRRPPRGGRRHYAIPHPQPLQPFATARARPWSVGSRRLAVLAAGGGPHLLGFVPSKSLIVIGAGPPRGRSSPDPALRPSRPRAAAAAAAPHAVTVLTSPAGAGHGRRGRLRPGPPGHPLAAALRDPRPGRPGLRDCGTSCAEDEPLLVLPLLHRRSLARFPLLGRLGP